jgi:hypothetical protein
MAQFGNADSGFFTNSQTTVACQFITCCTINQCGVIIPDSGCCSSVRCGASNCASGGYSATLGGLSNTSSGLYSAIVGGQLNNTCGFANSFIVGSNLCSTQACTTFVNCLSANNLTTGCFVVVGANKVLENSLLPTSSLSYGLFAQTSDSIPVTNTTVETTIIGTGVGTLSVPANSFSIGDSFVCELDGLLSSLSSATLHIRVKTLAGAILADTGIINMAAATNKPWIINLYFTIRTLGAATTASISSGGLFSYIRNGGTQFEGYVLSTVNSTTFDTTVNNTLVITAQWNTANTGDSIISKNFTLTKIK